MSRLIVLLAAAGLVALAAGIAFGQLPQPNDLFAVGQGGGDTPATAPVQKPAEPPFVATPAPSHCAPGDHTEPGVDGRVPAGSADKSLNCNLTLVSHQGTEGGFKVFRYVDTQGHVCAFYDTTLMLPLNALNPGAGSEGVAVLDMSNPAHPVQTDTLTTTPMLSPHESLNLNPERGLLAAVNGNLSTEPGMFAIYDVHSDCRHPVLDAQGPYARFGHESGFSSDGKTFYATSTALQAITAIDVSDPKNPHSIWQGNIYSHGMSLSDDGNRAYIADPKNRGLMILDTSQIQARKANPQTREISRLTWNEVSIPQNAIPFTENGHPYLLEIDEYNQQTLNPNGDPNMVGAARIIDIANEAKPFIVSNLRLQVDQPAQHQDAKNDPGANNPAQGYAAHYCNVPTEVDPKMVACSFIASGLRVFDISDLVHPKEVGYYVAPPQPRSENGYTDSDFAMSKPAFDNARHDIWWSDGTTGFYVLHANSTAWPEPGAQASSPSATTSCRAKLRFLVRVRAPRGARVHAKVAGKRAKLVRRKHRLYVLVDLRKRANRTSKLVIRMRLANGHTRTKKHTYRPCPS